MKTPATTVTDLPKTITATKGGTLGVQMIDKLCVKLGVGTVVLTDFGVEHTNVEFPKRLSPGGHRSYVTAQHK